MNADFNIQADQISESEFVDTAGPVHLQPQGVIQSITQSTLTSLFNRVSKPLYYSIFIGLFMYLLVYSVMSIINGFSMNRMNSITLLFPTSNHTRKTPTLAIVMLTTTDRINEPVTRVSVANKRNYVKRHGYEFILDTVVDGTRSAVWARVVTLHSAMHSRPDIEWFWHLDVDAFILEKQIDIYDHVIKKYQWGLENGQNITKDLLISSDCTTPNSFNAGSFLIRNSQWSKQAMRTLYEKQYLDQHFGHAEQGTMFWLYQNRTDWQRQVQIFPMRLANAFPRGCDGKNWTTYHEGDMVVHYAGYHTHLFRIWPGELTKWRNNGKLVDDIPVDVSVK